MDALAQARSRRWYHSIELAPDYVTEGWWDHRPYVHRVGLPERMDGMRALDVGTWDGFWAFEMERRGADVVALDLDDERDLDYPRRRRPESFSEEPRGAGFSLAHEILDSNVERVNRSIYDALPEDLGQFDLVFCGSVIMHLRDQLLALERIAALCRGNFISIEEYDPWLSLLPFSASRYHADRDKAVVFWLPSVRAWRSMLWTAGFDQVEQRARFTMPATNGLKVRHVIFHASQPVALDSAAPRG
jgi:tRNA (mo5U34)-methyltransferase